MRIIDKINMDKNELMENGPINIVAFGDSITHGALGAGEIDFETVYWNLLRKKINAVRKYVPVNVINAGIGGTTATESVGRTERDVLSHSPDLIIICFGLNDINDTLSCYTESLGKIFRLCKKSDAQIIYMTPNMLNTYVCDDVEPCYKEYAAVTAECQTSGKMDLYIRAACDTAKGENIEVCDCYAKWRELERQGIDTTRLLINRINHPTREMHGLFANSLFDIVIRGCDSEKISSDTMYRYEIFDHIRYNGSR